MLPKIAVTMGDPAGIGPEIALLACLDPTVRARCRPVLCGRPESLEQALASRPELEKSALASLEIAECGPPGLAPLGRVSALGGQQALASMETACALCRSGEARGMATAPVHKQALKMAGISEPGHTEILARLCGVPAERALTLFQTHKLRIFFLSRHLSLRQALELVRRRAICDFALRCDAALDALLPRPRKALALAALNPHSGDGALFGREEQDELIPAVGELRSRGLDIEGPIAADSVFYLASRGDYSAVISLYHDQGHIAAKTLDFEGTIAFTLGLPFLRSSVDHGTAFDIAGSGRASAASMRLCVLALAEALSGARP